MEEFILVFSIEELPDPKNTGVFSVEYQGNVILDRIVTLDEQGIDDACFLIEVNKKKLSEIKEIRFFNISGYAKDKILKSLSKIRIR
ncbi:hypothetical protein [Thermodesulfovibrio sp. TK110]